MTERAACIRAYPEEPEATAPLAESLQNAARLARSDEANAAQVAALAEAMKLSKAQIATLGTYSALIQSVKAEPGRLLVHLLGGSDFDEKSFVNLLKKLGASLQLVNWDFDGGTETGRYCIVDGRKAKITDFIARMAERDPQLALLLAIEESAVQAGGRLLRAGQDPNAFVNGRSLLSIACRRARMRIVELLLKVGADPRQPNRDVEADRPINQIIRRYGNAFDGTDEDCRGGLAPFLDGCADLDGGDGEGVPPLLTAAGMNFALTCRLLLERGAGIDRRDEHGRTALFYATTAASERTRSGPKALALLLECGTDPRVTDSTGNTALYPACKNREAEALLLATGLSHEDLVVSDPGLPPLHQLSSAIIYNQPRRAAELLTDHPDLLAEGAQNTKSLQPIGLAAHYGRIDILEQLLALDPELQTVGDTSLATVAAANGQLRAVRCMLDFGLRVDSAGDQSLLMALEHGHDEVARLLVVARCARQCRRRTCPSGAGDPACSTGPDCDHHGSNDKPGCGQARELRRALSTV